LFIKDDRWTLFLPKSEGAVYGFRFINFYSPFFVPLLGRERCSWMLKEAVIGWLLLVIIALSSAKSPTREVGIVG